MILLDTFPLHDKYQLLGQNRSHKARGLQNIKTIMARNGKTEDISDIFLASHLKGLESQWRHFLYVPSTAI